MTATPAFSRRKALLQKAELPLVLFLCTAFYFACGHDDLLETSNHAWLLLDCIGSGRFGSFYEVVMAHENPLYYVNNAHYNILCYLLYALWQLPVRLVCVLTRTTVNEYFLMYWSKAVGVGAFAGCAVLLRKLAAALGFEAADARLCSLSFVLHPIAFFAVLIMGQYDTLCLLFLLAALLAYTQGRLVRFSLFAGAAMVFKFFPLLLFLPLLVLAEKRPLRCLGYAALSFWLSIPTGLLFRGRTGDMSVFNELMLDRVFAAKLPGGLADIPVFLLLYALLLLGCYLYRPRCERDVQQLLPWLGLAVFGLLFLVTAWHPQWLLLLVPFWVLVTLAQRQRAPWLYLSAVLFFGYWLCMNLSFPGQLEANLFSSGVFGPLISALRTEGAHNALAFYLGLFPRLSQLAPVLFSAPIAAAIVFTLPLNGKSLGDRLAARNGSDAPLAASPSAHALVWLVFAGCIPVLWLGSAAFVLCKSFG